MTMQNTLERTAAVELATNCLYLAADGSMHPHAKTAEFFRSAGSDPDLAGGHVLAMQTVRTPQDVHYPTWEMHPEGEELLIVASGALSLEFCDGDANRIIPLPSQSAFVVPTGVWHRVIVHEPSLLIVLTPRHGTVLETA